VQISNEVLLFISLGVGAAIGAAWYFSKIVSKASLDPAEQQARTLAMMFHERVHHFSNHVRTLDDHSNEYCSVFSGDTWNSLTETLQRLTEVDNQVQRHLSSREYDQAKELLKDYYRSSGTQAERAAEWENSLHVMLKSVVLNLETATQETKKLAERPQRSRKRQPTLVTLADVKKALLEDEAFRRGS
jgi:hypothetical protein